MPCTARMAKCIAGAEVVEDRFQLRAVVEDPGGLVRPNPYTAGLLQGVGLQVGLLLGGADPGVAEEVSHTTSVPKTAPRVVDGTLFLGTACEEIRDTPQKPESF
jgi:hypothetical protein